jgi:hypothetical protein
MQSQVLNLPGPGISATLGEKITPLHFKYNRPVNCKYQEVV